MSELYCVGGGGGGDRTGPLLVLSCLCMSNTARCSLWLSSLICLIASNTAWGNSDTSRGDSGSGLLWCWGPKYTDSLGSFERAPVDGLH